MAKSKRAEPRRLGEIANLEAFSIDEFCARHCFSRAYFYKLRQEGHGPREMKVGTRVLITAESAAAWRREREAATEAAAA
jgi:predicted DNA-binding transcriptional regulator AlpA